MSRKIRQAARIVPLVCVAAALAGAPLDAQSVTVLVALQGTTQGKISGESTGLNSAEIQAFSFSMSQPYGGATPVARVTTSAYAAPRLLQALVTNEALIHPVITFVKPGRYGAPDSTAYRISALHGNIVDVTLVLDSHREPSMTFDLLLSGGVSYTTGGNPTPTGWTTGGNATTTSAPATATSATTAATAPPPTVSGSANTSTGVTVVGKFVGVKTGALPADPAAGWPGAILLDSVALSMSVPVLNGAVAGKAMVRPIVIVRPASEDASAFAAAKATSDVFSKVDVLVRQRALNGNSVATIEIESDQACDVATPSCGTPSGMATGQPGVSAGLGGQRAQTALSGPVSRIAIVSRTAAMQLRPAVIKVTNHLNNTVMVYTP